MDSSVDPFEISEKTLDWRLTNQKPPSANVLEDYFLILVEGS